KVLAEYKKRGLKIYPVGVGTARGVKWLSLLRGYKKGTDYPESIELDQNWRSQVSRLDKANLLGIANSTGVQLGGYDWTVESYQDRAQNYLERVIDSNRRPLAEFTEGENDQNLWQYCLLISVAFLFLGFATYPFRGYFRKT
ncbi:MAG: hypothetical protein HYZ69_04345, partial [Candidatus Colwellbacteria bacterium]|nr:hypothetical protein [Candidatus Colwellbacteria bacterium]